MLRDSFSRVLCVAAIFLASCGGGDAPDSPVPPKPLAAAPAGQLLTPTQLMDWAEQHYTAYFPGHETDRTSFPYTYRAYSNGNYLAVTNTGEIWVQGPGLTNNTPYDVGPMSGYQCTVLPATCGGSVSGTAAVGGPLAGRTVTLKDALNHTATTSTSAAGTFTFSTDGLTGPFLLQASTASGTTLYSVTAGAGVQTANLTPLTDLVVRSWYAVQGIPVDTAFANPVAAPPPAGVQVKATAQAVLSLMQLALTVGGAGVSGPLDLITMPFTANHAGLDGVLDMTRVSYAAGSATVTVNAPGGVQTTTVTYDTAQSSMTANTSVHSESNTSSSTVASVIPASAGRLAAWNAIEASLSSFAAVINAKGASLTTADLLPYLDAALMNDGLNRTQFATGIVSSFMDGQGVTLEMKRVASLDLATGRAQAVVTVTQIQGGEQEQQDNDFDFVQGASGWLWGGNGRIAEVDIYAEARLNLGANAQGSGPSVSAGVQPVQGTVSAVSVTTSAGSISMSRGATGIDEGGVLLDSFFGGTGTLPAASVPPAGTPFTVTMSRPDGSTVTLVVPLNALTTEIVPLTGPSGSALSDAHLGGSLALSWQLPQTYAVARVRLAALVYTGTQSGPSTFRCEVNSPVLGTSSTQGVLNMPTTCNGQAIKSVTVNLNITGVNGERSITMYSFQ
ncbi:hypothetical protein [Caenimonas aquaedulcis]|uniref:Uncharacterized protein n=1 Tax=Caenimonas aquaedulcis TaxID=2793270 RepID=A0A931H8Q0_9BURK|nr:hypothetical protein [Caenimonas aquaedulcis]MBG9390398.1 hypothetical protein [Caenimonas aquaedulcis]